MRPSLRPSFSALRFLLITLLSLAAPLWLRSQASEPSQISGVVTDQTGAAVATAEVVFTSGSFTATQVTDNHGEFGFSQITAVSGAVRVSAHGFRVDGTNWRSGKSRLQITLLPG